MAGRTKEEIARQKEIAAEYSRKAKEIRKEWAKIPQHERDRRNQEAMARMWREKK